MDKKVVKYTKLSIQGIEQPPYEVEIFHKDGSVYTLEVSEYPVFDQEDRVCFVDGIAHDIPTPILALRHERLGILLYIRILPQVCNKIFPGKDTYIPIFSRGIFKSDQYVIL